MYARRILFIMLYSNVFMFYVICNSFCYTFMCVQHDLKFMYKSVGSCHMYCTCSSITLHSKLYVCFINIYNC